MGEAELIALKDSKVNRSDVELIGSLFQEMDRGQDFVSGTNNYTWFYLIGKLFRPKAILEMGTRFGYSMKCFVDGAGHDADQFRLVTVDAECDGIKTLDIYERYFRQQMGISNITILRKDTRHLGFDDVGSDFDLALVDAHHSVQGCYHECEVGWVALKPGGILVVDDIHYPEPAQGFDRFCSVYGAQAVKVPSFRGTGLALKPSRKDPP